MGIDYVIHHTCDPKAYFSTEGILERLKARDRANAVIRRYRDQGEAHRPDQIDFEILRRAADGSEVTERVNAAALIEQGEELDRWGNHCTDCPANRLGTPFGCVGYINYPISNAAEIWLLQRLPNPETSLLPYLMMDRGMKLLGYTGEHARHLRDQVGIYFENPDTLGRKYHETFMMTADQVFEMMFMVGPIQPSHAAMLLILFEGIERDNLDADDIVRLSSTTAERTPDFAIPTCKLEGDTTGDVSTRDLKAFFRALHWAYKLNVPLVLDV